MAAEVEIFGIRHHGPGSARTLLRALNEFEPDAVLIEGPPDADPLIPLAAEVQMEPPVALLLYESSNPSRASFYPFARFSPEWQALRFALEHGLTVGFCDLPAANRFAMEKQGEPDNATTDEVRQDPLGSLAAAAGFEDGERWWEQMFEHRRDETTSGREVFRAVLEAMTALRESVGAEEPDELETCREAAMRKHIRAATREHARVAVVCGAWHAPALDQMPTAAADNAILKGMPKTKVDATWVPWTHRRLSVSSGYGAGVRSPGWYDHLWSHTDAITERWLTRVARLLRDEDLDASSAHVIESSRLAHALAAMRDRAIPGLDEITEATEAVLCAGDRTPLALIEDRLIIGDKLGMVPDSAPTTPLHDDLNALCKRLRLKPSADETDLDLDLRKDSHLERSHLLHRLTLLDIPWGTRQELRTGTSTFHEIWRLQWLPELSIAVIEAGAWGNTIADASLNRVRAKAAQASSIGELTELVGNALLADLPGAAETLVAAIANRAAVDTDVAHLLAAFAPLARVTRYGNVRQTDTDAVFELLAGLEERFCVGLPPAARSLSDEAAQALVPLLTETHSAMTLVAERIAPDRWHDALARIALDDRSAPAVAGKACRLLLDIAALKAEQAGVRLSLALSRAADPAGGAAWVEGFLAGSGLVLVHDDRLFEILDDWIGVLADEHFLEILPVLRRTFSTFAFGERRMLGERARRDVREDATQSTAGLDQERAERALGVFELIMKLSAEEAGT